MGVSVMFTKARNAGKVKYYGCYDFNADWYLVEMLIDISVSEIRLDEIIVPERGIDKSNWQCAYMEQYLNIDGTERICDTHVFPDGNTRPCRIAFFIYKSSAKTLQTPFGKYDLKTTDNVPERLKRIIEFE